MSTNPQEGSRPTVVLVHGAFADASGWNGVVERLHASRVQVTAPANPLRGISIDSAYINSLLDQIPRRGTSSNSPNANPLAESASLRVGQPSGKAQIL